MTESSDSSRDRRGNWHPAAPIALSPVSRWPIDLKMAGKWLFGWPGYIWPENIFWFGVALFTWAFLTPALASMQNFEFWWVAILYARNLAFVGLVFGGMHYYLYMRKGQGDRLRYTTRPFPTDSSRFRFGNQVQDNMFHTLVFAVPVMTAYEAVTYWLFANGFLGLFDMSNPVAFWGWCIFLLLLSPWIHAVHFYFGHRLLHQKTLYKHFHSLHHNNVQVGPWSGLSMHPLEHVIYFSTIVVQWLVALHPVNALYQLHLAAFLPAPGHSGYEKMDVCKGVSFASGSYFHYLHHKHFECNYGGSLTPLDAFFGTFHDGTPEADDRLRERLKARRRSATA